jgi:hypothetical protein
VIGFGGAAGVARVAAGERLLASLRTRRLVRALAFQNTRERSFVCGIGSTSGAPRTFAELFFSSSWLKAR